MIATSNLMKKSGRWAVVVLLLWSVRALYLSDPDWVHSFTDWVQDLGPIDSSRSRSHM
jgi:hypothetical protein